MSKDIRSFFTSIGKSKNNTVPAKPKDDTKDRQEKNQKKKKRRVISSDSEDEKFIETKKINKVEKKSETSEKPTISISDVFGGGPAKRSKTAKETAKSSKDRLKPITAPKIDNDDDEDFYNALTSLDDKIAEELKTSGIKKEEKNVDDSDSEARSKSIQQIEHYDDKNSKSLERNVDKNKIDTKISETSKLLVESKEKFKNAKTNKSITSKNTNSVIGKKSKSPKEINNDSKSPKEHRSQYFSSNTTPKKDKNEVSTEINENSKKSKDIKNNGSNNINEKLKSPKTVDKDSKPPKENTNKHDSNLNSKKTPTKTNSNGKAENSNKTNNTSLHSDEMSSPVSTPKNKRKRKLSEEITDEERFERKRHSAMLYKNYLNRTGPKHHGSKEVPEGEPDCLKGCVFLVTGVLDSFERDEVSEIVKRYGGEMKQSLSSKVTHMICGDEAGPAKVAKAESLKVSIITEDDFLDLIKNNPNSVKTNTLKPPSTIDNIKTPDSKKKRKENSCKDDKKSTDSTASKTPEVKKREASPKKSTPLKISSVNEKIKSPTLTNEDSSLNENKSTKSDSDPQINNIKSDETSTATIEKSINYVPLSEKYRPKTSKQIIGQQGESSCAQKLYIWLSKWYQRRLTKQPAPNPWSKGDGGYYKAILLSGPPGVGKTTTATVVSKELGFDIVEFNASDTRSKNLLKEHITDLTTSNSLFGFFHGKKAVTKKHVIIMDEVDGMAGNEDRGGMQELINLIKNTSVPIICICNDKSSPKMRSLTNNCFDLTFNRPRMEQIKAAVKSICFKEGMKIPPNTLEEIINASSQDMRQIINTISLWYSKTDSSKSESESDSGVKISKKDIKLGPWSVIKSVFSEEEHKNMTIKDKSDLFFHDYSLAPLFVQQNYLKVVPHCPKKEILDRFSQAADSLSLGDLVDTKIRRSMAWNLLPVEAIFCSVIPGTVLSGHIQGVIDFPGWLGQNSKTNKMNRLTQEIHAHTRLSTSGSKRSIRLDYAPYIYNAIMQPLIKDGNEGVDKSIEVMQTYNLLRDDMDSLLELSTWSGNKNKMAALDSKVKSAFTRNFNKVSAPLPYAQPTIKKGRSRATNDDEDIENDEGQEPDEVSDDDNIENDTMIKKPSKATSSKAKPKKETKKANEKESKPKKVTKAKVTKK